MTAHVRRFIVSLLASGWLLSVIVPSVGASCGSVSCFVVIGSQQQVPMAGLLTVNTIYNYTPLEAPSGQGGSIPFTNQENQTLTLANLNTSQNQDRMSDRIRLCNGDTGLCSRTIDHVDDRRKFSQCLSRRCRQVGVYASPSILIRCN